MAAPAKLLPSILKVHQYCSTCCPTFIHVGLANALDLPETEEAVCKMVDAFAKRREVLIEGLDQIPGITYVKPEGAFYAMVDVSAFGVELQGRSAYFLCSIRRYHKKGNSADERVYPGESL